jgi:hypothetical protein
MPSLTSVSIGLISSFVPLVYESANQTHNPLTKVGSFVTPDRILIDSEERYDHMIHFIGSAIK